jgi:hypothetical protein
MPELPERSGQGSKSRTNFENLGGGRRSFDCCPGDPKTKVLVVQKILTKLLQGPKPAGRERLFDFRQGHGLRKRETPSVIIRVST